MPKPNGDDQYPRALEIYNQSPNTPPRDILSKIQYGDIESFYFNHETATIVFFTYLDLYLVVKDLQKNGIFADISPIIFPPKPNLKNAYLTGATRCIKLSNESRPLNEIIALAKMFGEIEDVLPNDDHFLIKFLELKSSLKFMKKHFNDYNYKQRVSFASDPCSAKKYLPNTLLDPSFYSNNRTIYLGGIQQEITAEDIFNTLRGGEILSLKILKEKKCAFVDFVNCHSANAFLAYSLENGCTVHKKFENGQEQQYKLKVNRGAENCPPVSLSLILYSGATRALLLGNPDNRISLNEVLAEFGTFGEIEMVNFVKNKQILFINFCAVLDCFNAFQYLKNNEPARRKYNSTVAFGKDRCGNETCEDLMRVVVAKRQSEQSML